MEEIINTLYDEYPNMKVPDELLDESIRELKREKDMYDFCFFYHPHVEYETQPNAQLGLGLLSLATYAKQLGARVSVINAQSMLITKSIFKIPICNHLILYGCLIDKPIIYLIIKYMQAKRPNTKISVGGPIAKSFDISYPSLAVLEGPGEDYIQGLTVGSWIPSNFKLRDLAYPINHYPFPDRSLIQGEYGGDIFKHRKSSASTTILTSRGCVHNCAFCTSGSDNFYQAYSMNRIEKELEHCLSLGIKDIRISDDNLLSKRLDKLCELFKEAGIRWRASIRTYPNGIDIYKKMKWAGCEELSFGVESGDRDVLSILSKGTLIEENTLAIQNANKAGISITRVLMMMGTPGETNVTLARNIDWVSQAKPKSVSLKMFVPYPGTAIYENPGKYNCKINVQDVNNSSYRPDNSEPKANIKLLDSNHDINDNFQYMKRYLENLFIENRG